MRSKFTSPIPSSAWSVVREKLSPLDPLCVYVFGSAARNALRPDSDVDIAVLARQSLEPFALFTLAGELEDVFGYPVDLLDLASASTVMAKEVVSGGKVLLDLDPRARERFEMLVYSNYARLNEERNPVLARLNE